ncbi:MAG: hypothetical protein ACO1RA_20855 [Planctomycetaceae bacterium]
MSESTPPFLLWTLAHSCPFRQIDGWDTPERTERHLRAAQVASDAILEGLVQDGIAIRGDQGFRIAETLALYGGQQLLQDTCGQCPANSLAGFAGCFGLVPLPETDSAATAMLQEQLEANLRTVPGKDPWLLLATPAKPRIHSVWLARRLPVEFCLPLAEALSKVASIFPQHDDAHPQALARFQHALKQASLDDLPIHLQFFPTGTRTQTHWNLPATCPSCLLPWQVKLPGTCPTCQFQGHPTPPQSRRARGTRPYFPLARLKRTS